MKRFFLLMLMLNTAVLFAQIDIPLNTSDYFNSASRVGKNKVKREFIYVFKLKKDQMLDSAVAGMISYDTLGNITSYERYDVLVPAKSNYQYNENGQLIKVVTSYPKNLSSSIDFMYDSLGNEIVRSSSSKFTVLIEWKEYNEKNQLIRAFEKLNAAKKYLARKYFYHANGNLLKSEGYEPNGLLSYTERNQYSEDSLIISNYIDNKAISKLKYTLYYNKENQLIKKRIYGDQEYEYHEYLYNYNPDGTLAEWTVYSRDKLIYIKRHHYSYYEE